CISQLMPELLALPHQLDGDGAQQRAVGVQLQRRSADNLLVFSRNEHRPEMLVDARQRQLQSREQSADLGQVTLARGFDRHGCDSWARGAQQAPPAGLSSTYSWPNER